MIVGVQYHQLGSAKRPACMGQQYGLLYLVCMSVYYRYSGALQATPEAVYMYIHTVHKINATYCEPSSTDHGCVVGVSRAKGGLAKHLLVPLLL